MSVNKESESMHGMHIVPVKEALDDASLDGRGSLTQQVYRLLRGLAVKLTLLPNQFLSEKDVAASLSISKTPVREAFIRLAEDGIVRIVPKSGTYVAPIDTDRGLEGYFIRNALEASCAAQAAEQYSLDDIGLLREMLAEQKRLADIGDAEGFEEANDRFHDAIFAIADLPDARRLIEQTRFEVDRILRINRACGRRSLPERLAGHSAIVNAIAGHDAEAARERMTDHLAGTRTAIEALANDTDSLDILGFLNRKRPGTRRSRSEKKS